MGKSVRKALKQHGQPRTITLDGFEPNHSALRRMGMRNEFNYRGENPVKIRSCLCLQKIPIRGRATDNVAHCPTETRCELAVQSTPRWDEQ